MEEHYSRLADKYDDLYSYEDGYAEEHASDIIKWLELKKTDILADIGGGTGKWSRLILKQLKLDSDIIMVEQNEVMTNIASQVVGITGVCEDMMTFMSQEGLCFDKCLIRSCLHHVADLETFIQKLYAVPSLQKALILSRAGGITLYPTFKKVAQLPLAEICTSNNHLVEVAKKAGFEIYQTSKTYQVSIKKEHWLHCIENRAFSALKDFSDEELKEGQKEIYEQYPGDTLTFSDVLDVFVLSRTI